ncbi:uncharacterized protein snapc2 [Eucyclogobius newberryi]|uniref:uncharacterized protein snapc2 n=1 Tax=Eucyclogobius newberryi TaxID=166745 RepID=UPI003B59B293
MKPPARKRVKKSRELQPELTSRSPCKSTCKSPCKSPCKWRPLEQRKLLTALTRLCSSGAGGAQLDLQRVQEYLPSRTPAEINSVLDSLKEKVVSFAKTKQCAERREALRNRKPLELWIQEASAVSGAAVEESLSSAFFQFLSVASTESCAPSPPGPLRSSTLSKARALCAPEPCAPPSPVRPRALCAPEPCAPPSTVCRPRTLCASEHCAPPIPVRPRALCAPEPCAPPSPVRPRSLCAPDPCAPPSPVRPRAPPSPVRPRANSTEVCLLKEPFIAAFYNVKRSILDENALRINRRRQSSIPSSMCHVSFEKIYHYLSVLHQPDQPCMLSPLESAVVLDLLMSLPEQLLVLDCDPLIEHFTQKYQHFSSNTDPMRTKDTTVKQQPATAPPTQQQPATAPPTQQQPATAPPTQQQPATAPPTQQQPATAPPTQQQPATAPPTQQQPATAPPTQQQPATAPPTQQQPATAPPTQQHPAYAPPTQQQPATAPPTQQQPATAPPTQQHPPTAPPTQQHPPTAPPTQQHPPTAPPTQQHPPTAPPTQQQPPTAPPTQQQPPTAPPTQQHPPTAPPAHPQPPHWGSSTQSSTKVRLNSGLNPFLVPISLMSRKDQS